MDLVKLARKYGMRLMGPNCMGLINLQGPIVMSWCATLEREPNDILSGDVGLVCQSGALLGSIWDMAMGHGLGYSALLSTGNEADLEASDFVEYFALDEKTRVITAFIEGLRNPQRFLEAVDWLTSNRNRSLCTRSAELRKHLALLLPILEPSQDPILPSRPCVKPMESFEWII